MNRFTEMYLALLTRWYQFVYRVRPWRLRTWLRAQRCRALGHQDQVLEPIGTGMRCLRCGRTTGGWTRRTVTGPRLVSRVR